MTMSMKNLLLAAATSSLLAAGCGGSEASSTPIAIAGPGFTFAPVTGRAGGVQPGASLGADCIGNFPTAPQHTLELGAAIPRLRILVNAGPSADTTIAVRTPDGHTVCNDDSGDPGNGLNPVAVIENAAPGTYQVFVGGYEVGDAASAYRLGVTEAPDAMPSAAVPAP
ncbi:MAG: hypothetical protein K1X94_34800 [Sandaracinaceae bacterium]|nr:hypothetical protein [Sandaracinaceae bacterium]